MLPTFTLLPFYSSKVRFLVISLASFCPLSTPPCRVSVRRPVSLSVAYSLAPFPGNARSFCKFFSVHPSVLRCKLCALCGAMSTPCSPKSFPSYPTKHSMAPGLDTRRRPCYHRAPAGGACKEARPRTRVAHQAAPCQAPSTPGGSLADRVSSLGVLSIARWLYIFGPCSEKLLWFPKRDLCLSPWGVP